MNKFHQAKDITDINLKRAVEAATMADRGALRSAICELFPEVPSKVVNSKLRQGVRKGIISGCPADTCARRNACLNPTTCDGTYRVVSE